MPTSEQRIDLSLTTANPIVTNVACQGSVYVGAVVYAVSSGTVANAIGNSPATSKVIGICIKKQSTFLCDVLVGGYTPEIYSGLDVTKTYYLSDSVAGGLRDSSPTTPTRVQVRIGRALNDKILVFQPGTLLVRS